MPLTHGPRPRPYREETMFRLISFSMHNAIEILGGFALMALPLVLGLGPAAVITGIAVGAVVVGLAFTGSGHDHATGDRGTIPLGAHAVYDRGLAFGMIVAAVVLGLAGDRAAVVFFLVAGVATLALATSTRYSAATAR